MCYVFKYYTRKKFFIFINYPSPLIFWVCHNICKKKKVRGEDSIAFIYYYLVTFLNFFYVL